jgi:hypothetical protein
MKHYSSQKKSRVAPELATKIESKLLVSSLSRQTLPGRPGHPSLRQEKILQHEYNLKFMTDRKRASSSKALSRTRRAQKDLKQLESTLQPQRLFFEEDEYRQKYYDLHDTHLRDKQRWVSCQERLLSLKEALIEFLTAPSASSAR